MRASGGMARGDFILNLLLRCAGRLPTAAFLCMATYFGHADIALAANTAPTISGTPATTATVGTAYSFQPTASDRDGNKLTFKIRLKPGWATFSAATGTLTGTPSAAHVGTYSNIEISVTDGIATRALPKFSIKVVQASAPTTPTSVTLSWLPPTRNVDGSALTNLSGYRIHYGKTPGQYAYSLTIGGAQITSAIIQNLEAATWYFAIRAVTSSGTLSDFSTEMSKTLQ
ncbi:MAG: putative Ig domain-containing protein [Gammaproteobacteria bacterium]|jgi:hypothetical protein|nr:putative Ig domain-containing protein [Gammaproteobacteria bacterium]